MRQRSLAARWIRFAFIFTIIIMTGCSAPIMSKRPDTLPPFVKKHEHVWVNAGPGMTKTDILIKGHAYITLFARGEMNIWPGGPSKYQHLKPNWWVLFLRIGEKTYRRHPIPEGRNSHTFLVTGEGPLFFGYWCSSPDEYGNPSRPDYCLDDRGGFELEVMVWEDRPDERAIHYLEELCDLRNKDPAVRNEITRIKAYEHLCKIHDLDVPSELNIKKMARLYLSKIGELVEHGVSISKDDVVAIIVQGNSFCTYRQLEQLMDITPKFRIGKHSKEHSTSYNNILVLSTEEDGKLFSFLLEEDIWLRDDHSPTPRLRPGVLFQSLYSVGGFIADVLVWNKDKVHLIKSDLLNLIDKNPNNKSLPLLLSHMGDYFRRKGDTKLALSLEIALSEIQEGTGKASPRAVIFNRKGKLQEHLGNLDKAIEYFKKSIDRAEAEDNNRARAESLIDLGIIYFKLNATDEAMECFQQTWAIASEPVSTHGLEPGVREHIGDTEKRSLKYREKTGFRGIKHIAEFWIGNVYKKTGDFDQAYHMLSGLYNLGHSPVRDADIIYRLSLADLHLERGAKGEALSLFEEALQVARSSRSAQMIWRSHAGIGTVYEEVGNLGKAFDHYAEAIKVIEDMRGLIESEEQKASFINDKMYVYERIIGLLHRMMKDDQAFYYLESSRARAFLDMLGNKKLSAGKKGSELALLKKKRGLEEKIALITGTGRSTKTMSIEDIVTRSKELNDLKAQHQSVSNQLKKINPNAELTSMVSVNPFEAGVIQKLLNKDTALMEYYVGEERCYLFVVTEDSVQCEALDVTPEELNAVFELRKDIVGALSTRHFEGGAYKDHLRDLYGHLIAPVEDSIEGKNHLIIIPHGILHYLPFHSLVCEKEGEEEFLIERYRISYAPSASVLKFAKDKNRKNHESLFAAANPKTPLPEIPAAELEAKNVASLFSENKVVTGEVAKESAVKNLSRKFDYLLFSTHGEMVKKNPLKSNLKFTVGEGEDGRLTVDEIFDMEIKANLVTLSACETGLLGGRKGYLPKGDDLVGLTRAFIYAGTPSVVASLWKVADESTVELMTGFYRNLKTMNKADALREAQLDLMKKRTEYNLSHPFFWAPFILVGDWR